jgi:transposase
MSKRARPHHSLAFNAWELLAAAKGEKTLIEMAQQDDVHTNLINHRRSRLLEGAADVFGLAPVTVEPTVDVTCYTLGSAN